jgi:hypothetical protein
MSIVVFFDLGATLVIPRLSDKGSLLELKVLPFVPDVLDKLRGMEVNNAKLRLRVISNTGEETLDRMRSVMADARLLDFFDPALLLFSSVEGIDKHQKHFLNAPFSVRAHGRSSASMSARMRPSAGQPKRPSFVHHIIHCTFSM